MPDIFDQLPSPGKGDIFDQLPAQDHAASAYLQQPQHAGMDPLAVQQAFQQLQGQGQAAKPETAEQVAQTVANQQGGLTHFGNALGQTVANPIQGAVGLVAPQTGANIRQFNALTYGPQTGVGGFLGAQAGNLVNAPLVMNPVGRALGAAEAAGNKRIDIAEERAAGQQVGTAEEIARTAGTGALDWATNAFANKIAGKVFGGLAKPAAQAAAKDVQQILAGVAKRYGTDAITNEVISHAQLAIQNKMDGKPLTEGMGKESLVAPLIQTAAFQAYHEGAPKLQQIFERARNKNAVAQGQPAPAPNAVADVGARPNEVPQAAEAKPAGTQELQAQPQGTPQAERRAPELAGYRQQIDELRSQQQALQERMQNNPALQPTPPPSHAERINELIAQAQAARAARPETPVTPEAEAARPRRTDLPLTDHPPVESTIPKRTPEELQAMAEQAKATRESQPETPTTEAGELARERMIFPPRGETGYAGPEAGAPQEQIGRGIETDQRKLEEMRANQAKAKQEGRPLDPAMEQKVQGLADALQRRISDYSARFGEEAGDDLADRLYAPPPKEERAPRLTGGKQAGALALPTHQDIVGPGSIYHEEIKPQLKKLSDAGKEIRDTFRAMTPVEAKAGNEKAQLIFREQQNVAANKLSATENAFEGARRAFDKMDEADQLEFQKRQYDNEPQATPELTAISKQMYEQNNENRKALAALGHKEASFWTDHKYNMLWENDPKRAAQLREQLGMPGVIRPGKIEGKGGFLKKATLNDFVEGLNKGLVPKYMNPIEMHLATNAEFLKYHAGVKGMEQLVHNDLITRMKSKGPIPAGWTEVPSGAKGPLNGILAEGPYKAKLAGDGPLIAPEGVARILTNITKPSAIGSSKVFKLAMDANNTATQFLLGVSGFHLKKVGQELINMNVARAMDLKMKGETSNAAKSLAGSVTSPFKAAWNGGDIQKMILGEKPAGNPTQERIIDAMKTQFKAKPDREYETSWGKKFQKAVDQGGLQGAIRAGVHAVPALNEKWMQGGVFKFVQNAKLYMGHEMVGDYLRQNPTASREELIKETAKISDHLDNVLGLMNRDNLFWNRTVRDLATLGTLSVGWNYGTAREFGGAAVDLGKGIGTLRKGGKLSDIDTRRISYALSSAALTALTGAAVTYMATGERPKKLTDLVFPPSGAKDRDGNPIRLNTGFYTSDIFEFMHDPLGTAKAKASPLVHEATDLLTNKDYRNNKIWDTDDPWYKMAGDVGKYLLKSNTPIAFQQLVDTIEGRGKLKGGLKYAGFAGVKSAPVEYSRTEAENAAHSVLQGRGKIAGESPEEGAKAGVIRDLAEEVRNNDPKAYDHIDAAIDAGKLTKKDEATIFKRSEAPTGLAGLISSSQMDARDLMKRVWPKMTAAERAEHEDAVRGKVERANLTESEREALLDQIDKGMNR